MSFGKTGSSDTWPLRHPHPTSQLPSHTGKFCPNVPRLMLIGILGTEQPLLLDTKCTNDTGVSGTTKWLPWCRKTAALLTEINIFRIVFFPVWLPTSMGTWQGGTVAKRRYIQFCKNSCEYDIFIITNFLIGTSVIFFIIFYWLLRPF